MVDLLNSKSIKSNYIEEEPNFKLPPIKKKRIVKKPVPHYPNVDVPMSEKEIM